MTRHLFTSHVRKPMFRREAARAKRNLVAYCGGEGYLCGGLTPTTPADEACFKILWALREQLDYILDGAFVCPFEGLTFENKIITGDRHERK